MDTESMMEQLILAFDRKRPSLEELAAALSSFAECEVQEDQLVVCEGPSCIYIHPEDQPPAWWFDSWPLSLVPADPKALVVAYRDAELAKRVVLALAGYRHFAIDTDLDGVYTSTAFAEKCRQEPNWTWRHASRPVRA